jgi:hypothetical protein
VQETAAFLERPFGWSRKPVPDNIPVETVWLDIGRGQEIHIFFVAGFEVSRFEAEFGRHIALFHPGNHLDVLQAELVAAGATIVPEGRSAPYKRFFFREPVNGYVFEVIDEARAVELGAR